MSNFPSVSIIIVNRNGMNFLKKCLDSILQLDYPPDKVKVIVFDNGSTDDSVNFIRNNYPRVMLMTSKINLGFAKANNLIYEKVNTKYVALLNNDTYVHPKWLSEMVRCLEEDHSLGAVSSVYLPYNSSLSDRPIQELFELFGQTLYRIVPARTYTLFPYGASCLIRNGIFRKLFEDFYFFSREDHYLGYMLWGSGKKILCTDKSIVWHYGGGSARRVPSSLIYYLNERNSLLNALIFQSKRLLVTLVPILCLERTLMFFYYLVTRNKVALGSMINAWLYCYKHKNDIRKKRKIIIPENVYINLFLSEPLRFKGPSKMVELIRNKVFLKIYKIYFSLIWFILRKS